ncbi:hypothetical protein P9112_003242 [Eukaryota sp. TZLM1-RC]
MIVSSVSLRPLVVFNALDHHSRRELDAKYAVGIILGYVYNNIAVVTNSFPLKHYRDVKEFPESLSSILELINPSIKEFSKRNRSISNNIESFLGLYTTHSDVSSLITPLSSYLSEHNVPLIISFDTSLETDDVPIQAHYCKLSDSLQYSPIETRVEAEEAERNALRMIGESALSSKPISSTISSSNDYIKKYESDLLVLREYLDSPKQDIDEDLLAKITNVLGEISSEGELSVSSQTNALATLGILASEIRKNSAAVEQRLRN